VVLFGVTLGCMNWAFYASLGRLPIGVAVTIEFLGPLTLTAALSRRVADIAAVLGAGVGVLLISQALSTPFADLDLIGLGLAAAAGACWAAYIVLSLEPAVAALAGLVVLHQRLAPWQLVGMALVVCASVLVMGARRRADPADAAST